MTDSIPTVTVTMPNDAGRPLIINESDYDPRRHTLWQAATTESAPIMPIARGPDGHLDAARVQIPADWRAMKYFALRALASRLTDEPVGSKDRAIRIIESELLLRG